MLSDKEYQELQEVIRRVRTLEVDYRSLEVRVKAIEDAITKGQLGLSARDAEIIAEVVVANALADLQLIPTIHDHSGIGEEGDTSGGPAFAQNGAKLIDQGPEE